MRLCGAAASGSGGAQARDFHEMEPIAGRHHIPTLSLTHRQVRAGAFGRTLAPFVEAVRTGRSAAA